MIENTQNRKDQLDQPDNSSPGVDSNQLQNNPASSLGDQSQSIKNSINLPGPESPQPANSPTQSQMEKSTMLPVVSPSKSPELGSLADIGHTWLRADEIEELRSRWNTIQVQFVDSPCSAIEQGDTLVAEILDRVRQTLFDHQNSLNQQWLNHDDISTEQLRITLQNYRAFLNYLLKL